MEKWCCCESQFPSIHLKYIGHSLAFFLFWMNFQSIENQKSIQPLKPEEGQGEKAQQGEGWQKTIQQELLCILMHALSFVVAEDQSYPWLLVEDWCGAHCSQRVLGLGSHAFSGLFSPTLFFFHLLASLLPPPFVFSLLGSRPMYFPPKFDYQWINNSFKAKKDQSYGPHLKAPFLPTTLSIAWKLVAYVDTLGVW